MIHVYMSIHDVSGPFIIMMRGKNADADLDPPFSFWVPGSGSRRSCRGRMDGRRTADDGNRGDRVPGPAWPLVDETACESCCCTCCCIMLRVLLQHPSHSGEFSTFSTFSSLEIRTRNLRPLPSSWALSASGERGKHTWGETTSGVGKRSGELQCALSPSKRASV